MISAVVATRNRIEQLRITLPLMMAQEGLAEVVVVDDGSDDGTLDYMAGAVYENRAAAVGVPDLHFLNLPDEGYSLNPARTYNLGIDFAEGDIILWSGGEVALPDPATAQRLAHGLVPGVIHLARVYNLPEPSGGEAGQDFVVGSTWETGLARRAPSVYCGHERPVPFMFLAALYKDDYVRVGRYDETLRHNVDGEFARRAMQHGIRFLGRGDVVAYHLTHEKR